MLFKSRLQFYLVSLVVVIVGIYVVLNATPKLPVLNENGWWGPDNPNPEDTSITPFKINIPKNILDDLQNRLKNHRPFTAPLEGIQHQYGVNTNLLGEIVKYWSEKYNWTERETYLNQFPQYLTKIQGLDIHFLHVKPRPLKGMKVLPLLLLHGWPGSVVEFYEAIPILTTPRNDYNFVFEVIAPSLPGFAFSKGATKPGLSSKQLALIFNILMKRLGFESYYVQGGDWGSIIGTNMAIHFPNNIKGIHLNMCFSNTLKTTLKILLGSLYPGLVVSKKNENRMYPLGNIFKLLMSETGHLHIQATKPDTIGVALSDSPAGLAAYILEKFIVGTNIEYQNKEDGGLMKTYTYDRLLDNVMVYYVTNSMTTAMRLYAESYNSKINEFANTHAITIPSACLSLQNEAFYQPESFLRDRYHNLVHYKEYDVGGHFAAFELPEIFSKDIWEAVNKMISL